MAAKDTNDYDPKEILEYCDAIVEDQKDRVDQQRKMRACANLNWKFESKPDGFIEVLDPAPADNINLMASIVSNKKPVIKCTVPKEAVERSKLDLSIPSIVAALREIPERYRLWERKGKIPKMEETFANVFESILQQNDERRDGAIRRDWARDGFVTDQLAACVWFVPLLKGYRAEEMDGKAPFSIERVDPITLYVVRDEYGVQCALRRWVRRWRDVKRIYKGRLKADNASIEELFDKNANVEFTEKWWRDENGNHYKCAFVERENKAGDEIEQRVEKMAWVVGNKGGFIEDNLLKFIPYVKKTCVGSDDSIKPFLGNFVNSNLNGANNIAWSLGTNLAIKLSNVQFIEESDDPTNDSELGLDFTDINEYLIKKGNSVTALQIPDADKLERLINNVEGKAQRTLLPTVTFGELSPGSPYAANKLAFDTGTIKIEPYTEALESLTEEVGQMCFRYLREYPEFEEDEEKSSRVIFWMNGGRTVVEPGRIPPRLELHVRYRVDKPMDKISMLQSVKDLWRPDGSGLFDIRSVHELVGTEDIDEVLKRRKEEQTEFLKSMSGGGGPPNGAGQPPSQLPPNPMQGIGQMAPRGAPEVAPMSMEQPNPLSRG